MSKIEDLIKEYCPDGVEYKKLDAVTTYERPDKYSVKSTAYDDAYETPVLTAGKTFILGYTNETDGIYQASKQSPVIIFDDFLAVCKWVDFPFKVKSSAMKFIHAATGINVRYLFYAMECIDYVPVDHARQWIATYSQFEIPVPPLPVQQEIVRILDSFTALQDELQKELEERSRQYKAVTNAIFVKYAEASKKTLADISENCDSARKPITASKRVAGKTPYYGASGIVDYVSGFTHEGDYLLISEDGANLTARTMPIAFSIRGKNWVNNHAHVLKFQNYAVQKYVETYINTHDISEFITGAAQPKLNQQNLYKIEIPIPDVDDVVQASDIFQLLEALRNQIELEFSLRQQQYTYYRDKLLSFPRKEA